MEMNFLRSSVALGLAIQLAASPGYAAVATQAIGTVVSTGAFRLNHATVRSNATLFEGAMVANGAAPVRMDLSSGARLELESESTVQVFGDRMVLQRGASRIDSAAGFRVEARGLTIQPDGNASTGRIVLIGARRVEVSAVTGSFRVLNPDGVLVAKIAAGRVLALEPQSNADSARIIGRLARRDGHYLLTDETTNVTMEVSGQASVKSELTKQLGQRVDVTGTVDPTAPVSGATQLIQVAQVTPAPPPGGAPSSGTGGGAGAGTAPAGAGGAAGGATGGAGSVLAVSATMIAVIAGVAAAAVVGGLAASGSLGGSTAAPVSR